jgi:mRNA-degrading endonuclease RelE of RelBE toxin-antitoxin system
VKILITERAIRFLESLPDKDLRIVSEHIDRLANHPDATGDIKRLTMKKERYRMHVSYRYTVFFYPDGENIIVNEIMTTEQAHKKYGRI